MIGGLGAAALVAASLTGVPASGAPQPANPAENTRATRADNLPNPLDEGRTALKKEALARVINGSAKPEQRSGSEVVRIGNRWAELKRKADKVDPVFAVLSEFSNNIHPVVGGDPGPLHNLIPQPNPATDNSTYWEPDFNQAHFNKMYNGPGESLADFYFKQSGGKYSTNTVVSDWVVLPFNEARYGSNDFSETSTYWPFVRDTANAWYNAQVAAGKTPAQIADYLKQFDVYDRYDADGDGNFNEADGYIDHFQAVHAGEGEEAGGGAQGEDAIWSHRWYAYSNGFGQSGPPGALLGGTQIGTSGIWVGDYTVQPENGGLGVFAHEFGHDLGLPDLYDTAGGDNSSAFWTLMSGGSWMSKANANNIGTSPSYMGPWEKMFLGWLDYTVVDNGKNKIVSLGSAATPEGPLPQAVVVPLPTQTIVTEYNTPHSGNFEWWGGSADGLNVTLARDVDLTGATTAKLTTQAWYEIEAGYDYLYGEVSTDGGANWTGIGAGIDGVSGGGTTPVWTELSYDLTPYAGQNVKFRFRYQTDGGVHLAGPFLDDLALVTNGTGWTDDVEAGAGAWTASGFTRMSGKTTRQAEHFYLAEFRTFTGYDNNLKTGPYQFISADKVEKFPYQDGLLVWYVNYAFGDNNTIEHVGGAEALPIDARPAPIVFSDGVLLGNRRQPFDATFGTQATDAVTFHKANGATAVVPSRPGIRVFDDSDKFRYWDAGNPLNSVYVAGDGVKIKVVFELTGFFPIMIVQVQN
ncbi:MAG TPA: protease [Micromonosporaceae bacterium]|nr:protease [Micromonosporaceae bacterium]